MRRLLAGLAIAVVICGSMVAIFCEKAQAGGEARDGHQNSIVAEGVKVNGNNNIPYGQLKKAGDENGSRDQEAHLNGAGNFGAAAFGAVEGGVIQVADFNGQILGGHHNSIILEGGQVAGVSGAYEELVQGIYIDVLIDEGHHNLIFVDTSQIISADGSVLTSASTSSSSGTLT